MDGRKDIPHKEIRFFMTDFDQAHRDLPQQKLLRMYSYLFTCDKFQQKQFDEMRDTWKGLNDFKNLKELKTSAKNLRYQDTRKQRGQAYERELRNDGNQEDQDLDFD